jgi:hypothetical protein
MSRTKLREVCRKRGPNGTWVSGEAGRKLLYFASDIDLANPAVWKHQTPVARSFDVDQQERSWPYSP